MHTKDLLSTRFFLVRYWWCFNQYGIKWWPMRATMAKRWQTSTPVWRTLFTLMPLLKMDMSWFSNFKEDASQENCPCSHFGTAFEKSMDTSSISPEQNRLWLNPRFSKHFTMPCRTLGKSVTLTQAIQSPPTRWHKWYNFFANKRHCLIKKCWIISISNDCKERKKESTRALRSQKTRSQSASWPASKSPSWYRSRQTQPSSPSIACKKMHLGFDAHATLKIPSFCEISSSMGSEVGMVSSYFSTPT